MKKIPKKMAEIFKKLKHKIEERKFSTICPKCNGKLKFIKKYKKGDKTIFDYECENCNFCWRLEFDKPELIESTEEF
jgi:uncharacterized protein with PIN domain